jgi:hypothetical protein
MADTKISADPSATDLVGAVVPIVQAGANKKAAAALFQPSGAVVVITATGTTAVAAGTTAVIINLAAPGSVTLTLPAVAGRSGIPLLICDWAGNADITLTPDGTEKIMGLGSAELVSAGQGLGTAASIKLHPTTTPASGWFA